MIVFPVYTGRYCHCERGMYVSICQYMQVFLPKYMHIHQAVYVCIYYSISGSIFVCISCCISGSICVCISNSISYSISYSISDSIFGRISGRISSNIHASSNRTYIRFSAHDLNSTCPSPGTDTCFIDYFNKLE